MIYPDNPKKSIWDLWITLILLITCIVTPVSIAFKKSKKKEAGIAEDSHSQLDGINNFMDIMFAIDIIVIFFSAIQTEDMEILHDRKTIIKEYLTGWFLIDVLAIFPFEWVINSDQHYNSIIRVARFGRLYKLVKLFKLIRIVKIIRE